MGHSMYSRISLKVIYFERGLHPDDLEKEVPVAASILSHTHPSP